MLKHQIQLEMPVNGQDMADCIGHLWNKNGQIQIVLSFAERLDFECLKRAVNDLLCIKINHSCSDGEYSY